MTHAYLTETWWEKSHLSIIPSLLKQLLRDDGLVHYRDPMTGKVKSFDSRYIQQVCEYDKEYNEYVFPIEHGKL